MGGSRRTPGRARPRARCPSRARRWPEALDGGDAGGPLGDGLKKIEQLVDVLKGAAAAQHGGGRAAEEQHGRLGHLRVLDGRHGVGDARPGRDGGHAHVACEARGRVRGEDRVDLLTHVDHAHPMALRAHQDRRDVPAARGVKMWPMPLRASTSPTMSPPCSMVLRSFVTCFPRTSPRQGCTARSGACGAEIVQAGVQPRSGDGRAVLTRRGDCRRNGHVPVARQR